MIKEAIAILVGVIPSLLKKKPVRLWYWTESRWIDAGTGSVRRIRKYIKQAVKNGSEEWRYCITPLNIKPTFEPKPEGSIMSFENVP